MTDTASHEARLREAGAEVSSGMVTLYRGADVAITEIKRLRYGDYLSAVKDGQDATGNCGASSYGKNVAKFVLPASEVAVTGAGEFQFKGASQSLNCGTKFPQAIYRAYNDAYGSNYTAAEVDAQDNVRSVASQALAGGSEEFDALMERHSKQ